MDVNEYNTYPGVEVNHGSGSRAGCKSSENESGELGERGEQLEEWFNMQTAQTFMMLEFFWCFLFEKRAAISVAGVLGFENMPFIRYPIGIALLENMVCPHSCPPRWTKRPPPIGSNQNQLPLPWRVARHGCPLQIFRVKMSLRFTWGKILPFPSIERSFKTTISTGSDPSAPASPCLGQWSPTSLRISGHLAQCVLCADLR